MSFVSHVVDGTIPALAHAKLVLKNLQSALQFLVEPFLACRHKRDRPPADDLWSACAHESDACVPFPGCTEAECSHQIFPLPDSGYVPPFHLRLPPFLCDVPGVFLPVH